MLQFGGYTILAANEREAFAQIEKKQLQIFDDRGL